MTIDVEDRFARRRRARGETSSPLRDDPVIQAFQKHLGADIVESRKR